MNALTSKVARLSGLALVTAGLVLAPGLNSPASAAEQVTDGGFEAAVLNADDVLDSPAWTEADSLVDSPLCDDDLCGTGGGTAGPRTGDVWAWFGGTSLAGHTGSLTQSVTIPAGTKALSYWFRNGSVSAPFDARLTVKVDSTTVKTHTEGSVADPAYVRELVDISAFADGAAHTLSFSYLNGGAGSTNMTLDDVSIETTLAPATTPQPTVTAVSPAGPASSKSPKVTGTAEAGSTVTLYPDSTCSGSALGSGTAAAFSTTGITVTVPTDATTTIYAQASKAGQFDSACSTSSVSYTNDSKTPQTTFTSGPRDGLAKSLTFPIGFASTETGSTFTCSLDGAAFAPCTSPVTVTVKQGSHTFEVVAKDTAGNPDATPAWMGFKAYDCARLTGAVTSAEADVARTAKQVAKAKKKLKKAKRTGDDAKVAKARKKLAKAKRAHEEAESELVAAGSGAAPCGSGAARALGDPTAKLALR